MSFIHDFFLTILYITGLLSLHVNSLSRQVLAPAQTSHCGNTLDFTKAPETESINVNCR